MCCSDEHDEHDEYDDTVTRCRYCEADTHHLDYCPKCGRMVRGMTNARRREERDLTELIDQDPARRLNDGYRMMQRAWEE